METLDTLIYIMAHMAVTLSTLCTLGNAYLLEQHNDEEFLSLQIELSITNVFEPGSLQSELYTVHLYRVL